MDDEIQKLVAVVERYSQMLRTAYTQMSHITENMACTVLVVSPDLGQSAFDKALELTEDDPLAQLLVQYSYTYFTSKLAVHSGNLEVLARMGEFDRSEANIVKLWKSNHLVDAMARVQTKVQDPLIRALTSAACTRLAYFSNFLNEQTEI